MNSLDLFNFCVEKLSEKTKFFHVNNEEIEESSKFLADRFRNAVTIAGTRSFHKYRPLEKGAMACYSFSNDKTWQERKVHRVGSMPSSDPELVVPQEGDFIAFRYNDSRFAGRVRHIDTEFGDCSVEVLKYRRSTCAFCFDSNENAINMFIDDIIGIFEQPTMALKKEKTMYKFNHVELNNWLNISL